MATQVLLENLLTWLQWAETTLTENDKEALPQEIEEIKALITEHQVSVRCTNALHTQHCFSVPSTLRKLFAVLLFEALWFDSVIQTFMEEMTRKQPDVDKITKTHKRKVTAEPPVQSQIPVLEKGRTGRRF